MRISDWSSDLCSSDLFRVVKKPGDYWNYHGHEFPYIGWNELTKYMNSDLFEAMMSTNRTSFVPALHSPVNSETGEMFVLPPIPLEVFATTNPYGIGHMWVKRVFIDPAEPGVPETGRASCRAGECPDV